MAEERENMNLSDAVSIESGKPEGKENFFCERMMLLWKLF